MLDSPLNSPVDSTLDSPVDSPGVLTSVAWQVNALLAKDRRNYSHDLSIQRYAVSPLSHNAGVVGWVPNTDTLHQLIRQYRETRSVRILLILMDIASY